MQLQDLDDDNQNHDDTRSSSRTLDRKKRDVQQQQQSEQGPAEVATPLDAAKEAKPESRSSDSEDAVERSPSFPSLYALEDAVNSQYGTVRQRSARQLRGQTSNQPWPSDYELVDTPYSSSNVYYNTNKGVSYHNRPSQNVPYIQYADKSPHSTSKAKKSNQNTDIIPLLLNSFGLQKQSQQRHTQQQSQQQQYLDDEENNLPDNFSYFHLGKGNGNSEQHHQQQKKKNQLNYNYVSNTTPKGSGSYIAFSTVGGFYNNQPPVTQSPNNNNNKYLKQQYFTPSDGRFFANSNGQGNNKAPSNNYNSNQEETFYGYQNIPNTDRPIQIGNNKPKYHHQPDKVTPSYEGDFYPTNGYSKNVNGINQHQTIYNNFQSPYVEEVAIKPKRPNYESSTSSPKGQAAFYGTEKPRNVQVIKEKPVYESPESENYNRKPSSTSAFNSGFEEFLAGIRTTNYQDVQPTYMKNLTMPKFQLPSSTQKPNNEYFNSNTNNNNNNDEEYYYDDEYEDPPIPQPQHKPLAPVQRPVNTQHSNYHQDNSQYFYSTAFGGQNGAAVSGGNKDTVNTHFKIPIQPPGHHHQTTLRPTTKVRPKPLTTSTSTTSRYPSTTPYTPNNSDEYYYDDEDYEEYKIPLNASKYMPMSETMAPRPTQPANLQRPHSPYNKYNVHTSNYHYTATGGGNEKGKGPNSYDVDTLDNVEDNGNENEYEIDIRILNSTGTKNQIPSKAIPSIIQFPDDYFQGINLRGNNSKPQGYKNNNNKVKTTELYKNPSLVQNHQPTYRPVVVTSPSTTTTMRISSPTTKYTRPMTASSTPSIVTIKQRPTTMTTPTVTMTTQPPPVPTTRKVYTVRPNRFGGGTGQQKWRPTKKNKDKTEQLELDERLPNR